MKKSTKGALAAGTAAVLLLGGAGTLAFWSDSQVVEGGAITSGNLALEAVDDGTWTFNGAPLADVSSVAVVPGDELTFSGEYRILADGDNIQATVGVSGGALSGGGSLATELTPVVTVGGEPDGTLITESDNGDVVTIDATFDFDFAGASNSSKLQTVNLSDLTISLTQVDSTP